MDLNNTTTPEAEKDTAQTPPWFVRAAEEYLGFKFDLDVCCQTATAKCEAYYSLVDFGIDSLKVPWGERNWCNPPYSDISPWVIKAASEAKLGNISCLLIPDKPEVGFVRAARIHADTIIHMPFRLNFLRPDGTEFLDSKGKKQGPKFPVLLALFTPWGVDMPTRDVYVDFRKYKEKVPEKKYIGMLSGGRDSTAMIFMLLERGFPIDYILFTNTQSEFPEMYEYLEKVSERLKDYGKELIVLEHRRGETFEDWCFGEIKRGERKGMIRGIPMVTQPCYWKRESKVRPFERFIKDNNITDYVQYIGYTYSERDRANVKDKNQKFPLIEFKKCEADVDQYLKEIDLVNPLYKYFERTGCNFCPYQKIRGFYVIWKMYPDQWAYMKDVEHRLNDMENVLNPQWNIRYSIDELEHAFINGIILHEVEAPVACECGL